MPSEVQDHVSLPFQEIVKVHGLSGKQQMRKKEFEYNLYCSSIYQNMTGILQSNFLKTRGCNWAIPTLNIDESKERV